MAALCSLLGTACATGEDGSLPGGLTTLTTSSGDGETGSDDTEGEFPSSSSGEEPSSGGTSSGTGMGSTSGSTSGVGSSSDTGSDDSSSGGTPKFDVPQPDVGQPDRDCGDPELVATLRDFPGSHVDMQAYLGDFPTKGMVAPALGPAGKPVLANSLGQVTDAASFAQWYETLAGLNLEFEVVLPLTDTGNGTMSYDSDSFFPLDGQGFGNEGYLDYLSQSHNFHFTTEIHTEFTYQPGQVFTFSGDDDLWMFIDGQLRIDLGGVHPEATDTVNLDTLGFIPGTVHSLDIFHAERHTDRSNFKVTTTIACFHDPQG